MAYFRWMVTSHLRPNRKTIRTIRSSNIHDDAHGDGVLGENGRGITNHFKLDGKVDFDMGTFSKAFGTMGGYIGTSKIGRSIY